MATEVGWLIFHFDHDQCMDHIFITVSCIPAHQQYPSLNDTQLHYHWQVLPLMLNCVTSIPSPRTHTSYSNISI
jgi:hypothetical protein